MRIKHKRGKILNSEPNIFHFSAKSVRYFESLRSFHTIQTFFERKRGIIPLHEKYPNGIVTISTTLASIANVRIGMYKDWCGGFHNVYRDSSVYFFGKNTKGLKLNDFEIVSDPFDRKRLIELLEINDYNQVLFHPKRKI